MQKKNSLCSAELVAAHSSVGSLFPLSLLPRGRRAVYSCNAQTRRVTFRDFTRARCRASPDGRSLASLSLFFSLSHSLYERLSTRRPMKTEKGTSGRIASRRVTSRARCVVRSRETHRAESLFLSPSSLPLFSNVAISRTTSCSSRFLT